MSNIKCDSVMENLSAFIDGEVDKKLSDEIKKHLCECIPCRRSFSDLMKMQYLIKNYFKENIFSGNSKIDYEKIFSSLEKQNDTIYIK